MPIIRILTSVSGLDFSWYPGEQVLVSAEDAERWCDGERAVFVGPTDDELAALDAERSTGAPFTEAEIKAEFEHLANTVTVVVDGVDAGPGVVDELPDTGVTYGPLPEAVEGDTTEHLAVPDYSGCTVAQLRAVLTLRELSAEGKRPELLARLVADDEARAT
jgi:hypothetical protein